MSDVGTCTIHIPFTWLATHPDWHRSIEDLLLPRGLAPGRLASDLRTAAPTKHPVYAGLWWNWSPADGDGWGIPERTMLTAIRVPFLWSWLAAGAEPAGAGAGIDGHYAEIDRLRELIGVSYDHGGRPRPDALDAMRRYLHLRDGVVRLAMAARTATPAAGIPAPAVRCRACGSLLDARAFCPNRACVYFDWRQAIALDELRSHPTEVLLRRYGAAQHRGGPPPAATRDSGRRLAQEASPPDAPPDRGRLLTDAELNDLLSDDGDPLDASSAPGKG